MKLLLLLFGLILLISPTSAWVTGYGYRMPIEINNTGDNLTNWQYNFTMDTATEIAIGNMTSDNGSDCYVTDSLDGLLSFWNETPFNTSTTKIWVNASHLSNVSNTTHYIYYGKSDANSEINGTTTFELFDDFEGSEIINPWTRYSSNPILSKNTTSGSWDYYFVNSPYIAIYTNGTAYQDASGNYYMYYSASGNADGRPQDEDRVGLALSTDLYNWTRADPVIAGPGHVGLVLDFGANGQFDDSDTQIGSIIYNESIFDMWYTGNAYSGPDDTAIGYANSTDGKNWTKYGSNPILDNGVGDDDDDLYAPNVIYDFDTDEWKMWYIGQRIASSPDLGVMYATAPGNEPWNMTKYSTSYVYTYGTNRLWGPYVWKDSTNDYNMIFANYQTLPYVYHWSNSTNGIDWTHNGVIFENGEPGTWDAKHMFWMSQINVSGTWYSYYVGKDVATSNAKIGVATGTYRLPTPVTNVVDAGKWDQIIGSGGTISQVDGKLRVYSGTGTTYVSSNKTVGNVSVKLRAIIDPTGDGAAEAGLGTWYLSTSDDYITILDGTVHNNDWYLRSRRAAGDHGTATQVGGNGNYNIFEIKKSPSKIEWYTNDTLRRTETNTTYIPVINLSFEFGSKYAVSTKTSYLDWIYIRNYVLNEPTTSLNTVETVWWNASWNYYKTITINQTMVNQSIGTGHYPLLVSRTDTDLRDHAQADGDDIVFTNSANITQLAHEIELWNSTTGELVAWVDIEDIKNVSSINMYYNNSGATNTENASGVWDWNYEAVWHMSDDPGPGGAGDIKDSTGTNNGTAETSMISADLVSGQIGYGIDFDGTDDYVDSGVDASIRPYSTVTTSAIVKRDGAAASLNGIITSPGQGTSNGYILAIANTNYIKFYIRDNNQWRIAESNSAVGDGINTHVVGTCDGTDVLLYINGTLQTTTGTIVGADIEYVDYSVNSTIAKYGSDEFKGQIDEGRVSNGTRSHAYIETDFNNSFFPTLFISIGAEQSSGSDTTAPAVTNVADSPDPQGYGENVSISATVTDGTGVHTVLLGVTPPGGSETNYTMSNSGSTYSYNYTGWDNGSHSYTIHANDSAGNMNNSESGTFTLSSSTYVHIKTLKDVYVAGEYVNITDPAIIPGQNINLFGMATAAGSGRHLAAPNTTVYKVTNLNDNGSGSLRYGLENINGPKVIIFEVSGVINITSTIKIGGFIGGDAETNGSYITIAGQTAPPPGITITGAPFMIERGCHDILIQHIHFRPSDENATGRTDLADALNIAWAEGSNGYPPMDIVIDHCSFSWAVDENVDVGAYNFSFINNIISEALYCSIHDKSCHSKGMIVLRYNDVELAGQNTAIVNNLFVHNADRNPVVTAGSTVLANNLIWKHNTAGPQINDNSHSNSLNVSVVANYINDTDSNADLFIIIGGQPSSKIFIGPDNWYCDAIQTDPWYMCGDSRWERQYLNDSASNVPAENKAATREGAKWITGYNPLNATVAKTYVLANAGAFVRYRDVVDTRVTGDVVNTTGGYIDMISLTNASCTAIDVPMACCTGAGTGTCIRNAEAGFPSIVENTRILTIPANPHVVQPSGYTKLEEWLFSYTVDVEPNSTATLSNRQPSGVLAEGTTSTYINLSTNKNATCRYQLNTGGTNYTAMTGTFSTTGLLFHNTTVSSLTDGNSYTYCVRCNTTAGYLNDDDYNISFSVGNASNTMTTWDSTDGALVNASETAYFYVNYTNASGAIHGVNDWVNISYSDTPSGGWVVLPNSMVYNATTAWYETNQSYGDAGQYYYRIRTYQNGVLDKEEVNYIDIDYQSRIYNKQTTNPITAHVLMKVEYDNAGTWVLEETIYNASQQITTETNLKLDDLFNGSWHTTDNISNGDGTYRVYVAYTDPAGTVLANVDGTYMNDSYNFTIDTVAPTYTGAAHSSTEAGESTTFSIQYNDTVALNTSGSYIFSTNNTGAWVNNSAVPWTATPQYANSTKTLNSTHDTIVGYRWYATDAAGNINNTPIYTLTVIDSTPPLNISNLTNTTGNFWHNWTWTNPADADFNHSYIVINDIWTVNSSLQYYNLSASAHNTSNISIRTADTTGNMNTTWDNHSSTIPNNAITISGILASYNLNEGGTLSINANYTDPDTDTATFADNSSEWNVNSSTGIVSWVTVDGDDGVYNYYINVSDGYGSTDQYNFTVTVLDTAVYIPPDPITLANTTGNFYVNYTWSVGAGNVTDSYNISQNGTWVNGSSTAYNNSSVGAHGHSNIIVYAYNTSGNGTLSTGNITDNVTVPNNVPVMDPIGAKNQNEGTTVSIDVDATDLDSDTLTFACNRTDLFADFNTGSGIGTWTTNYSSAGVYSVLFSVADGYTGTDTEIVTITINNVAPGTSSSVYVKGNEIGTTGDLPVSVSVTGASWETSRMAGAEWDYKDGIPFWMSALGLIILIILAAVMLIVVKSFDIELNPALVIGIGIVSLFMIAIISVVPIMGDILYQTTDSIVDDYNSNTLTFTGTTQPGDTVNIGSEVYTFTNGVSGAYNVDIGASANSSDSATLLAAEINANSTLVGVP